MDRLRRFLAVRWRLAIEFLVRRLALFIAPIVTHMARTGAGSDECLRRGSLPLAVDFHSPVPDLEELEKRRIWNRKSQLAGVDFHPEAQVVYLMKLGEAFGRECDWPATRPAGDSQNFYTENQSFSFGCAASCHCILRYFKPHHVVEIGSGNSSLVISKALLLNGKDSGEKREYIVVDPYPGRMIEGRLPGMTQLVKERVELLSIDFFDQLNAGDVLFIDSGHTVRIGGDVNYLILDILPRLAPGVIIHFHDIGLPYEYPKIYATNPKFRVFWTEAYLLQAFLCFNHEFDILLAMNYLMTEHREAFQRAFPFYDPLKHRAIGGSFWIQRR